MAMQMLQYSTTLAVMANTMKYKNTTNYPLPEYCGIQFLRQREYNLLKVWACVYKNKDGAFCTADLAAIPQHFEYDNSVIASLHSLCALGLVQDLGRAPGSKAKSFKFNEPRVRKVLMALRDVDSIGFGNMDKALIAIVKKSFELGCSPTGFDLKEFFYSTSANLKVRMDTTTLVRSLPIPNSNAREYRPTSMGIEITESWLEVSEMLREWKIITTTTGENYV